MTERKLPSEWAQEGVFFIGSNWQPRPGDHCDYYDVDGVKRTGTVRKFTGDRIVIDGERVVKVTESFRVRRG